MKILVINFSWIHSMVYVCINCYISAHSHIWEKWDMGENTLGKKKTMKYISVLQVEANSWKFKAFWKFFGGHDQTWEWAFWSQDSEISCVLKLNLFFKNYFHKNLRELRVISMLFSWAWSKSYIAGLQNLLYLENEFKSWAECGEIRTIRSFIYLLIVFLLGITKNLLLKNEEKL